MNQLKHTPGPWKTYKTEEVETHLDIVIESELWTLGWLYSESKNAEANARLISCAPEMLEQLIDLYKMMGKLSPDIATDTLYHNTGNIIEKATGLTIDKVLNDK